MNIPVSDTRYSFIVYPDMAWDIHCGGGWDSPCGSEIQTDLGRSAFLLQIVRLGFKPVTQPGARAAFFFFWEGGARPFS